MTDESPPKAHKSSLTAVAVSPCGGFAFTASKDGGLVKWAVGEEKEGECAASVRRVGRVCAAGGHGAREEDMAKGKSKKAKGSKKKQTNYGPRINAVAVSSDGKFLVSTVEDY